ncbi:MULTISPECIES: mycoredoxin [Nocardiaceae]|uniref:mycoredoxin n=1 Tax=Nocardiaceae TaxID=85025 RepID=UPI00068ACA77
MGSVLLLTLVVTTTENTPQTPAALTVYSTTWCGYCRRLKTQLDEAGITYAEIDIEQNPEAADFVGSVNNGNHVVPTVLFADGSTATNPGLAEVKRALSL